MSIALIPFKDASGTTRNLNALDTGSGGPYVPMHVIGDTTGTPINPATDASLQLLQASLGGISDTSWGGSGSATTIALLKNISLTLSSSTHTLAGVLDSAGGMCFPDSYAQALTYNIDSTVNTIAFTNGTNTWTQTLGYTSGKVSSISLWVKS